MPRKKMQFPSHVTFSRLPFHTWKALENKSKELRVSVSKLIVKAVQKYLGISE